MEFLKNKYTKSLRSGPTIYKDCKSVSCNQLCEKGKK